MEADQRCAAGILHVSLAGEVTMHDRIIDGRVVLGMCFLVCMLSSSPGDTQPRPQKKLIEYGWDVPSPEFIRDNIRTMEARPFDGIMFRTNGHNHAFDTGTWKESDIRAELDVLSAIEWETFTDNFLMLYAANRWDMDFFNDNHWQAITNNLALISIMVKAGRCVGVCFDTEPYGKNPWNYPGDYGPRSFDEVESQVRKRGAQFMTALQSSTPDIKILSFFQLAQYDTILDEPDQNIRDQYQLTQITITKVKKLFPQIQISEKVINQFVAPGHYSLLPAFFNGMLEAASSGVTLIDGNELSYWYENSEDYYRGYHMMKQRCQSLVSLDLRPKYSTQMQAGMALYVDDVLALKAENKSTASFLTTEEKLKFFEHNTYYALTTTDEYVWLYSERMNWWKDIKSGENYSSSEGGQPPGLEAAVISAREKHEKGLPLGFDVRDMIHRARNERRGNQ